MECKRCGDYMENATYVKCCFCRFKNKLSQRKRRVTFSTHRPNEDGLNFSQIGSNIIKLRVKILDKLNSYKSFDQSRGFYDEENFIDFEEVFIQICKQEGKCKYCSITLKFLNFQPYQQNQFSIDRIYSSKGHIKGCINLSCLKCNIKKGKKGVQEYIKILQEETTNV